MMKRAKQDEKMQQVIQKLIAKIDADPYDQESYYALGTALTEEKSFTQAEELLKKHSMLWMIGQKKQNYCIMG